MPVEKPEPQPYEKFHKDGSLWARGQMLDGVQTGYWEWFRKEGTQMRSGHFENGQQVGEWITYDREGKVHKVTRMKGAAARCARCWERKFGCILWTWHPCSPADREVDMIADRISAQTGWWGACCWIRRALLVALSSIAISLVLGGCASSPPITPNPLITPSPTPPAAAVLPPARTPSPTPSPSAPASEPGSAYLLVGSREFHWLQTIDLLREQQADLQSVEWQYGSPIRLAERIGPEGSIALRGLPHNLNIFRAGREEPLESIPLLHEGLFSYAPTQQILPVMEHAAVMNPFAAPVWMPSEPVLTFAAAQEGEWVNIYLLDLRTGEISRLIEIEEHTIPLGWSPGARYLAFVGGDGFTLNGYTPRSLYLFDRQTDELLVHPLAAAGDPIRLFGWAGEDRLVFAEQQPDGWFTSLTLLEIPSARTRVLASGPFRDAAVVGELGQVLIAAPAPAATDSVQWMDLELDDSLNPRTIGLQGEVGCVEWYPLIDAYGVESEAGTALISPDGAVLQRFPNEHGLPAPSPDGRWLGFGPAECFYDGELRVYSTEGELILESDLRAHDLVWWPDSQGLLFAKAPSGIGAAEIETGRVGQPWTFSAWELLLLGDDLPPFDQVAFLAEMSTSTPIPEPPAATPEPTAQPAPMLRPGAAVVIHRLWMQDAERGWALGIGEGDRFERVLYTWNGGETWVDVSPPKPPAPTEAELPYLSFDSVQQAELFAYDDRRAWVSYSAPSDLSAVVVWRTEDAGFSWHPSRPIDVSSLRDYGPWVSGFAPQAIEFIDPNVGWLYAVTEIPASMMVADTVLLRTEDGGETWEFIDARSTVGAEGFSFLDRQRGWMLDSDPYNPDFSDVRRTSSGGEAWHNDPMLPVGRSFAAMRIDEPCFSAYGLELFAPDGVKMILSCRTEASEEGEWEESFEHWLYLSTDGGSSFRVEAMPVQVVRMPGIGFSTYFLDTRTGWLLDFTTGNIFRTGDGGHSWTRLRKVAWVGRLHFVDHLHGWAIASESDSEQPQSLVRTADGGFTWDLLHPAIE